MLPAPDRIKSASNVSAVKETEAVGAVVEEPSPQRRRLPYACWWWRIKRACAFSLLENTADIDIVGEATNGREAVALTRQLRPDVVLMDIHMPIMNGIDATRLIHAEHPAVRVIGLSTSDEEELIAAMWAAGAEAYVQKGPTLGRLVAAIRGEREGEVGNDSIPA